MRDEHNSLNKPRLSSPPLSNRKISRRSFLNSLLVGAAVLSSSSFYLRAFACSDGSSLPKLPKLLKKQNEISPDAALKRLMDGNARYTANTAVNKDCADGRSADPTAQYPIAAILSCSDSRVEAERDFDQQPGDIFQIRVAGNFLDEDGLASIEYAVKFLGVPLVMVLGHSNCGAVKATIKALQENVELPGHLYKLAHSIKPAVSAANSNDNDAKALLENAIIDNIQQNVDRLKTAQPIVAPLVKQKKIKIVGAFYDIASRSVRLV